MYFADKVFINGKFYTMESEGKYAEAVAVKDGKFIFVGTTEEAVELAKGEIIDLQGAPVLPAFTDTHIHLVMDCEARQRADLKGACSIGEVLKLMKEKAENIPHGRWVQGTGLHIEHIKEQRFPDRHDLDKIAKDVPILVQSYCGHIFMLNSKALEKAGIGKGFKWHIDGLVDFDDDGEPTGIVREGIYNDCILPAMGPILPTYDIKKEALYGELKECVKNGIVCASTYTSYSGDPLEYLYQYKELEDEGRLPVRIILNSSAPLAKSIGAVTGIGNENIMIGAKKLFSDGSLNSRSAALFEGYSDEPETYGVLVHDQKEMNKEVLEAYQYGMEVSVHAIGDRAMEMVITAAENAVKVCGVKKHFRIIHAMLPAAGHIERMKKLPVILDVQPIFLRNWVDLCEERIGKERMQHFMPLKSYMDAGMVVTGGSDAPVEDINPLLGIECAVTRTVPGEESGKALVPKECISVFQAVSMFTKNAAFCTDQEKVRGTITPGKLADFIVLSKDIFTIPKKEIHKIKVEKTIKGGVIVYESVND
ncbi:amidohydrolase [Ruminococcus sp. CLA-AA-H200]|uniref:Amidohydrolase n=1 Tax=Ruminococcus turbiniformis TaxID=2881258 RepID=A0ABS8FU88_9FIRM|nr:amidohydrolase [Ruminococcus turbiniformis]MCC2253610.1 amidohydrolase [Ruminococcus turbiniformis]